MNESVFDVLYILEAHRNRIQFRSFIYSFLSMLVDFSTRFRQSICYYCDWFVMQWLHLRFDFDSSLSRRAFCLSKVTKVTVTQNGPLTRYAAVTKLDVGLFVSGDDLTGALHDL